MASNVFADVTHMLGLVEYTPPILSIKKFKKCENTKIPHMIPTITQNTHIKLQKYPQMLSLCFVFSEVKDVLMLYSKI
jgi:hypothetical protein